MSKEGSKRPTVRQRPAKLNVAGDSWLRTGIELDRVELEQLWTDEASSFSDWLKSQAVKACIEESNLWRYLAAVRFYPELRRTLIEQGFECPVIEDVPKKVSPENLELLSKLVRVMPLDEFSDVAMRVVNLDAKRQELRMLWQTYRSVLGGQTARGKGIDSRVVDLDSPLTRSKLEVAKLITLLNSASSKWLDRPVSVLRNSLIDVRSNALPAPIRNGGLDLLVVDKPTPDTPLQLHGVYLMAQFKPQMADHLNELSRCVNYLWTSSIKPLTKAQIERIPKRIGVIAIQDGEVITVRKAEATNASAEEILSVTQYFLQKALAR